MAGLISNSFHACSSLFLRIVERLHFLDLRRVLWKLDFLPIAVTFPSTVPQSSSGGRGFFLVLFLFSWLMDYQKTIFFKLFSIRIFLRFLDSDKFKARICRIETEKQFMFSHSMSSSMEFSIFNTFFVCFLFCFFLDKNLKKKKKCKNHLLWNCEKDLWVFSQN